MRPFDFAGQAGPAATTNLKVTYLIGQVIFCMERTPSRTELGLLLAELGIELDEVVAVVNSAVVSGQYGDARRADAQPALVTPCVGGKDD